MLPSVDLPAPLGPMMACTSPGFTSSVRPLRISRPATVAWRLSILSMGFGIRDWGFVRAGSGLAFGLFSNPEFPIPNPGKIRRSEEHTSELQSLMRISYAVFCLKKKNRRSQKKQERIIKQHGQ